MPEQSRCYQAQVTGAPEGTAEAKGTGYAKWYGAACAPWALLPSTVIEGSRPSSDPALCRVAVLQARRMPAASRILAVQAE